MLGSRRRPAHMLTLGVSDVSMAGSLSHFYPQRTCQRSRSMPAEHAARIVLTGDLQGLKIATGCRRVLAIPNVLLHMDSGVRRFDTEPSRSWAVHGGR